METYQVDIEELTYLVANGVSLTARIYRPRGAGPFPALAEFHGGAWIKGKPASNHAMNLPIAQRGVVVMAADYSVPPAGTYPSSVADANYAIRWLKLNATRFGSSPELVGAMGCSAGGQLAVLASLKPHDPRYAAHHLEGGEQFDATVRQVVTLWPVICPYTRYQENLARYASGDHSLDHMEGALSNQMAYWLNDDNQADGSPVMALERGDAVATPDILYVQAHSDRLHSSRNMDRFCDAYRKIGGYVEMDRPYEPEFDSLRNRPEIDSSQKAFQHIADFANGIRAR